ncbi:uncharacterized protein LOC121374844 [Gigantopelta aegis]|uniref:uncharacterized protein LOC121374844 n=1 Tax=Gigantopelta aegis TaxID=1735272 RepID=UPI001B88E448|nr:uncharacterized protein LOC121374844 [Gigantopelta aegis]
MTVQPFNGSLTLRVPRLAVNHEEIGPQNLEFCDDFDVKLFVSVFVSVWKIDVYPYSNRTGASITPYIPGWGFDGRLLNLTTMMKAIRDLPFVGPPGNNRLLDLHEDDLTSYSSSLEFYVNVAILQSNIYDLKSQLTYIWKQTIQAVTDMANINTKVVRQEECIDMDGKMLTKVEYTVSTNGITLLPQTLPEINSTRLQEMLTNISPSNRQYTLITTQSEISAYDKLFWLYLQQPVFASDIGIFRHYLQGIWRRKKDIDGSAKIKILFQEENFSMKSSLKIWKISYSLTSHSSVQDVRFHGNLNKTELASLIDSVSTNTTTRYTSAVVMENDIFYRISETFNLYVKTRVASIDYRQFEAALETIWSFEISGSITIRVATQEEIVNRFGKSTWTVKYVILQMEHVVSPRTLDGSFLDSFNVTNGQGEPYVITTPREHFRVEECLQVYLSQPLYRQDREHVRHDIESSLHRMAGELQNATLEWKGQIKFISVDNSSSTWRQLFVVKVDYTVVNYQRDHHLKVNAITINATSPNGEKYHVYTTDTVIGYLRTDMQYSITVIGHIQSDHLQYFQQAINKTWLRTFGNVTVRVKQQEELVGDNGYVF